MQYQRISDLSRTIIARFGELPNHSLTQTQWCQAIECLPKSQRVILEQVFGLLPHTSTRTVSQIARSKKRSNHIVREELDRALKALRQQLLG